MQRLLTLAASLMLLAACAAPSVVTEQKSKHDDSASEATEKPPATVPKRPFPQDSLYPLLVAEFALRRQAYDIALEQYLTLSPTLRDAGVAAHTTNIGQYLRREQDTLESARLWLELEPKNVEANVIVANMLIRQGRTLEALPHLAVAEREGATTHFPILLNGFGALEEPQRTALLDGVNNLAAQFPTNVSLLLTQALMQADLKHFDKARTTLDRLFSLEPTSAQALLLEAKILIQQKEESPFAHIDEVLEQNPDDNVLRTQYARLLTGVNMIAARKQFEILSTKSPRDGDLLLSLALINRETGDHVAAAAYLRQVLALEQRVDEAHYYLGLTLEALDSPKDALAHYMLVEDSREYLAATTRIAQLLMTRNELEQLRTWFAQQREQNPQYREQLFGMEADTLATSGAPDSARQLLDEALTQLPDANGLLYSRAMLSEQQDDLVTMEKDLRAMLKNDPDNVTALNALGYVLTNRTDRHTQALELISRALELQPEEPAILDSMGWVLYRLGRLDEAVQYLARAYAVFPDPEVAAHLGEVLWVAGKKDDASAVWRGALTRNPEHPILRRALDRLGIDSLQPVVSDSADAQMPQ